MNDMEMLIQTPRRAYTFKLIYGNQFITFEIWQDKSRKASHFCSYTDSTIMTEQALKLTQAMHHSFKTAMSEIDFMNTLNEFNEGPLSHWTTTQ